MNNLLDEVTHNATPVYERRALILDDNDGNRMILKFAMQMGKLEFAEAADAASALNMFTPGAFSVAFLDIELPDINGLEIAKRFRSQDAGIAIIMCSTNDDPVTISAAVKLGCDMFLIKPFQLDRLLALVKDIDRAALRAKRNVLIVDNTDRQRWEPRPTAPGAAALGI